MFQSTCLNDCQQMEMRLSWKKAEKVQMQNKIRPTVLIKVRLLAALGHDLNQPTVFMLLF